MTGRVISSESATADHHREEVAKGQRFEFGANWARFLALLNDARIAEAEASLARMLGAQSLAGKTFLDIGSGSGLFSLAARRLGASVVSFDYDTQSVGCTQTLRERFFPGDPAWKVFQGSVLDQAMLDGLGRFDIVYSWGVLHHTGAMWEAIGNAVSRVADNGRLFIAIYNHQVYWSRFYTVLKRTYVSLPRSLKWLVSGPFIAAQVLKGLVKDLLFLRNPFKRYHAKVRDRGMSLWYDWIDWIGGYPFEVARPEEIFGFVRGRGFSLEGLKTCGSGYGCNEFLFLRHGR